MPITWAGPRYSQFWKREYRYISDRWLIRAPPPQNGAVAFVHAKNPVCSRFRPASGAFKGRYHGRSMKRPPKPTSTLQGVEGCAS